MQNAEKTKFPFVFVLIATLIFGGFILFVLRVSSLFPEKELAQDVPPQDVAELQVCDKDGEVTFTQTNDTDYAVMLNNRTIGVIEVQSPSLIETLKTTKCHAYLAVFPNGLGGYINYAVEPLALYQVSFSDSLLTKIATNHASVTDISPNEALAVGVRTHEGPAGILTAVVLTDIATGSSTEYQVPGEWGGGGDAFFSPDGSKVAFSVAKGNPDEEASQIMLLDIATGNVTSYGDMVKDVVLHVDGWRDLETPDVR